MPLNNSYALPLPGLQANQIDAAHRLERRNQTNTAPDRQPNVLHHRGRPPARKHNCRTIIPTTKRTHNHPQIPNQRD